MTSESCSSFEDSSSIDCSSSVISGIRAAVCLALSLHWLCKLAEGPAVVTAFGVNLAMFFFTLPRGLTVPLSGIFLFCPAEGVFVIWGFEVTLLLVTVTGHETVMEVSVVVATMACRSLYLCLQVLLRSFCLFNSAYKLFIAFAVMGVVATKLVIHFPTTGS